MRIVLLLVLLPLAGCLAGEESETPDTVVRPAWPPGATALEIVVEAKEESSVHVVGGYEAMWAGHPGTDPDAPVEASDRGTRPETEGAAFAVYSGTDDQLFLWRWSPWVIGRFEPYGVAVGAGAQYHEVTYGTYAEGGDVFQSYEETDYTLNLAAGERMHVVMFATNVTGALAWANSTLELTHGAGVEVSVRAHHDAVALHADRPTFTSAGAQATSRAPFVPWTTHVRFDPSEATVPATGHTLFILVPWAWGTEASATVHVTGPGVDAGLVSTFEDGEPEYTCPDCASTHFGPLGGVGEAGDWTIAVDEAECTGTSSNASCMGLLLAVDLGR